MHIKNTFKTQFVLSDVLIATKINFGALDTHDLNQILDKQDIIGVMYIAVVGRQEELGAFLVQGKILETMLDEDTTFERLFFVGVYQDESPMIIEMNHVHMFGDMNNLGETRFYCADYDISIIAPLDSVPGCHEVEML
jgi:hypothetical protein